MKKYYILFVLLLACLVGWLMDISKMGYERFYKIPMRWL